MSDVTQAAGVPGVGEKVSAVQQAKNEAAVRLLEEIDEAIRADEAFLAELRSRTPSKLKAKIGG